MNLQKQVINPPKCEDDANQLFIQLKQLAEAKQRIKEMSDAVKATEVEIENHLLEFYKLNKESDETYKLNVEHGKIGERKQTTWVYEDEKSIIKQLKTIAPELVRTKEEIDKVKLKKLAMVDAEDGTVILGKNYTILDNIKVVEDKKVSISIKSEGEKDDDLEVVD